MSKPYKVIKFATDVTAIENERTRAENERQRTAEEQEEVVASLAGSLKRMAQGDLTARITAHFLGPGLRTTSTRPSMRCATR